MIKTRTHAHCFNIHIIVYSTLLLVYVVKSVMYSLREHATNYYIHVLCALDSA